MKMLNIFYTCKEKFKNEYAKDNFFFFSKLASIVIMQVNMEVLQIANVI